MRELTTLIGTDPCSYCGALTECLSLPDNGEQPQSACVNCIDEAFREIFGDED
jgi:hypothetical protein